MDYSRLSAPLTHAKHGGKYDAFGGIKVLHDDAFIINTDTCASVALAALKKIVDEASSL